MKKIRVFIIDEHPAVCRALVARLDSAPSIDVVGAACTFAEGLSCTRELKPDLVILEVKGKGEIGGDPIGQISRATADWPAGVIVLTSYPDEKERLEALEAGAWRYLLKNIDSAILITEIEAVAVELYASSNHNGTSLPKDRPAGTSSALGHRC